jgi:hypothetical protein
MVSFFPLTVVKSRSDYCMCVLAERQMWRWLRLCVPLLRVKAGGNILQQPGLVVGQ